MFLDRLSDIGVQGMVNKWFQSYLQNRHQSVIIRGAKSKSVLLRYGVLGPFLFTQYTIHDTQIYVIFDVDDNIDKKITLTKIER